MNRAQQIEQTAAQWIVRQEGGDWSAEDADALGAWLDQEMAHKAAFWRLRHGWAAADRVGALGFQTAEPRAPRGRPWRTSFRSRTAVATAMAASLALVVGIGTLTLRPFATHAPVPVPKPMLVQTPVGGQQTIALQDGSRVQLNTATVVRTATNADAREVWLDKGEAYFDIAHRPDRPFVVHAGPRTVTVLGTRFTVRRDGEKVTVAVLSGRVRVEDAVDGENGRAAVIGKGDIAYAQSHGTLVALAAPQRVYAMTGWRDGLLVFDNQRLADAIQDFNRYSTRPIRIDDPAVANIRIGGTFQINNSAGFLHLLQSAYGLDVQRDEHEVVIKP